MAKILVTGSADGPGKLAAMQLIAISSSAKKVKGAADILIADLSSIKETQAFT
ncbi:hypothetical protein ACTJKN_05480 [Pedobacter sp. 22163]|uniref:hypothetical protein n=1 Tax=Pedobacter sp. 22163 TaxID=3453883 RepID=UPI003F8387C3